MIKVTLADNQPVVHFGVQAYFKNHSEIKIAHSANNFSEVLPLLKTNETDVLVMDFDLKGLDSIQTLKTLVRQYPNSRILIYTSLSENMYAPNILKAGVAGYLHKNEKMQTLESAVIRIHNGEVVFSEAVSRSIALSAKLHKSERLYRKLSSRELEVLRYLSAGKKNHEISEILGLNEKTISTYKLRLLNKLNVTNLVDLVNKAKTLEIL